MRSLMDNCVYVNPFVEPISLDALSCPDGDDGEAVHNPVADPNSDTEELLTIAEHVARFAASLAGESQAQVAGTFGSAARPSRYA
jgi:hypothetical protein